MNSTSILLVAMQSGLQEAKDMQKTRRTCRDPRSTTGWPQEKEEAWNRAVDCARSGRVYWVSSSTASSSAQSSPS